MAGMRLGHAHLKVRNLAVSIPFYTEVFGLRVIEQVGNHYAFLTDGKVHHAIALQSVGSGAPGPLRGEVGLYHVAFEVADEAAFVAARQKLLELGLAPVPVDHGISWALYFNDPDGNGLEIYWDTRETAHGQALWQGENKPLPVESGR
jgi:catechol 2,3-dioxygenase